MLWWLHTVGVQALGEDWPGETGAGALVDGSERSRGRSTACSERPLGGAGRAVVPCSMGPGRRLPHGPTPSANRRAAVEEGPGFRGEGGSGRSPPPRPAFPPPALTPAPSAAPLPRGRRLVLRALAFAGGVWAAKRWGWGGEAGVVVGGGGPARHQEDLGGRAWAAAAAAGGPPAFALGGDGPAWRAGGGRELLAVAAKQYEPAAWEKEPTGVMAYLLGIVYLFLGIAIVCDDYFVASLEVSGRARPVSSGGRTLLGD